MAFMKSCVCALLLGIFSLGSADEIAWGDISADGQLETRTLDVPVAMARGADNFYISNPMDSHDWSHVSVVRNSLLAQIKSADTSANMQSKVAELKEALRPIFAAMPKVDGERLNNGTARYALHRLFNERHGWTVKGLQPAGAAWMTSMSVTPDVRDITKYMVPTYLQDMIMAHLGISSFDLHSLALLGASIEHLVHAETLAIIYDVFSTLGLSVPGKRSAQEVEEILDTFMMVYAFGVNLDTSVLDDIQRAKAHLDQTHSGWPQLRSFARDVKNKAFGQKELSFAELVQVAKQIGEGYARWQGMDCSRAKDELARKPSHQEGRVRLSDVQPFQADGRRQLFTESAEELQKFGVLSGTSGDQAELIIPNYVNSQGMCLSTASFYTACCVNECESILAKLERGLAAPAVKPSDVARLVSELPGKKLAEPLFKDLSGLADQGSGHLQLHSRPFAEWMHRAFPLECPAPHSQTVTNPMTADEWIGESGLEVQELEEMMEEIAHTLVRYTTMGKEKGKDALVVDEVSDPSSDIIRIEPYAMESFTEVDLEVMPGQTGYRVLSTVFQIAAFGSMIAAGVSIAKSSLWASGKKNGKGYQGFDKAWKDFA